VYTQRDVVKLKKGPVHPLSIVFPLRVATSERVCEFGWSGRGVISLMEPSGGINAVMHFQGFRQQVMDVSEYLDLLKFLGSPEEKREWPVDTQVCI
jgi:hypothetical protein